ncbi:MAG: peptidylprolyl isomerase [Crocinitomicaceae bacterium]
MMKYSISIFFLAIAFFGISQKKEIILTVNDKDISKSEFLEVYLKNNNDPKYDKASLDEYMKLYHTFQLIVAEAEMLKMDTIHALELELKGYERQLAEQYLVDNNATEALIREAYDHTKEEIRASHILRKVAPDASAEDTLEVYNYVMRLREEIISGKRTFEEVCVRKDGSEDPSAQSNKGDLGYFGAFQMVYPFEKAAFNTKVGEVSMPVRTKFGYHLIKVTDRRPARGTMKVDHIMILTQKGENPDKKVHMMNEIYDTIQKGLDFKQAIMLYSEDVQSKKQGGVLPEFGTGTQIRMVPEFEEAAFALKTDGEISKPFKSSFGWHIIRRLSWAPVKSYDEMQREIKLKVSRDSRSEVSEAAFYEKLKKEYKFKDLSSKNLQVFYDSVNYDVFKGNFKGFKLEKDLTLFTFKGQEKPYTQSMFLKHIMDRQKEGQVQDLHVYLDKLYQNEVKKALKYHEKGQLHKKYPKFNALLKEYREGVLLFELKNKNVWKKAIEDTTGLKAFFEANVANYQWPERIEAEIYECFNSEALDKVKSLLDGDMSFEQIRDSVNLKSQLNVRVTSGKYVVEDNDLLKGHSFKKGTNASYEKDGKFIIVKVLNNLDPGPKELSECRGQVIAAYQEQLEKEWIAELEKKYKVVIHEDVLYSLIK